MTNFFDFPLRSTPGLFITGTDTGVGKTVITCAMADMLVRQGLRVGVVKPMASGCRKERGMLVSDDAQALAHFAQLDPAVGGLPLVTPITMKAPVAPAVGFESKREPFDPAPIRRSLETLDRSCDIVLVEGIGGIMVPIDPERPNITVLDMARELGYPVVVVTRADLGTLNHTALTVAALRQGLCATAGLVVNMYEHDNPDPAMQTNRDWMAKMNQVPVLATVPRVDPPEVDVAAGIMHDDVRIAVALGNWSRVARPPRPPQATPPGQYVTYTNPPKP